MKSTINRNKVDSTILYVEDDPAIRNLFSMLIQIQFPDVQLYTAENGKIGFDLYKKHRPDIVVTDINMPIMDGIKMTRLIKEMNCEVTVIMISGNISEDHRRDAISTGINHFMNKPIALQEFCSVIEHSISKTIH